MLNQIIIPVLLAMVISGCGDGRPSEKFLKNSVIDQLRIQGASPVEIAGAEKGEIESLQCEKSTTGLICKFNLNAKAHVISMVLTGSGDWSPSEIK